MAGKGPPLQGSPTRPQTGLGSLVIDPDIPITPVPNCESCSLQHRRIRGRFAPRSAPNRCSSIKLSNRFSSLSVSESHCYNPEDSSSPSGKVRTRPNAQATRPLAVRGCRWLISAMCQLLLLVALMLQQGALTACRRAHSFARRYAPSDIFLTARKTQPQCASKVCGLVSVKPRVCTTRHHAKRKINRELANASSK